MIWDQIQTAPLLIYTFYTAWLPTTSGKLPLIRDIHFRNITSEGGREGVSIRGPGEQPIRNITLENVSFGAETGIEATNVVGLEIVDCSIRPRRGPLVTLTDNRNALLQGLTGPKDAKVLLRLEGAGTQDIRLLSSEKSDASRVELAPEVDKRELSDRVE